MYQSGSAKPRSVEMIKLDDGVAVSGPLSSSLTTAPVALGRRCRISVMAASTWLRVRTSSRPAGRGTLASMNSRRPELLKPRCQRFDAGPSIGT